MPPSISLVGRKFNRITVEARIPSKTPAPLWRCRCSCGTVFTRRTTPLMSGTAVSCGCHIFESRDLTGLRFGKLLVLGPADYRTPGGHRVCAWRCRCECGKITRTTTQSLRGGTQSCPCVARKHGENKSPLHRIWVGMRRRCRDENDKAYPNYGGRGIRVCARWDEFAAFRDDVGPRPSGLSLDRKENDGHYSCGKCPECVANGWPMNVRWATDTEQARNQRPTVRVVFRGEERSLRDWADEVGLPESLVYQRVVFSGWSVPRALTTPQRGKGKLRNPITQTYGIRSGMIYRCHNPANRGYRFYGARGITVCARWRDSRDAFLEDMGVRPTEKHSIDRKDNDGGYWCGKKACPECGPLGRKPNCRWATKAEQVANMRFGRQTRSH